MDGGMGYISDHYYRVMRSIYCPIKVMKCPTWCCSFFDENVSIPFIRQKTKNTPKTAILPLKNMCLGQFLNEYFLTEREFSSTSCSSSSLPSSLSLSFHSSSSSSPTWRMSASSTSSCSLPDRWRLSVLSFSAMRSRMKWFEEHRSSSSIVSANRR